ncbi:HAD-IB family hydrolase [uncultured Ferrimonas sp.]|uniref:HAD-IB family hydrolase n=1 Tax=uncultured Ferrimonas sp. TaxID=432640 RepID=UPI00261E4E0E|nr:HAD-IB family hydrolase [uncultured Ferrimonas sp.]
MSRTRNLALFDFDGTLTDNDNFSAFLWYATPWWRLLLASPLLLPLKWGWQRGWLSSAFTRRWVSRLAYSGRRQRSLEHLGQRYIAGRAKQILRPEAIERLRWHQTNGDTVVLVSASLHVYLQPWCQQHNIELLCSELRFVGGRATGGYVAGDCANHYKAQRVQARYNLDHYHAVYAYGDTDEDLPMLALADHPYLNGQPYTNPLTS